MTQISLKCHKYWKEMEKGKNRTKKGTWEERKDYLVLRKSIDLSNFPLISRLNSTFLFLLLILFICFYLQGDKRKNREEIFSNSKNLSGWDINNLLLLNPLCCFALMFWLRGRRLWIWIQLNAYRLRTVWMRKRSIIIITTIHSRPSLITTTVMLC